MAKYIDLRMYYFSQTNRYIEMERVFDYLVLAWWLAGHFNFKLAISNSDKYRS